MRTIRTKSAKILMIYLPRLLAIVKQRANSVIIGGLPGSRRVTVISNKVAKWIDPNFSLLELLAANSMWRSHLKNLWRILCESCPSSGVRAYTTATREVLAPAAWRPTTVARIPRTANAVARLRPVGPAPTIRTSVVVVRIVLKAFHFCAAQ
jgi:hypothetical protein